MLAVRAVRPVTSVVAHVSGGLRAHRVGWVCGCVTVLDARAGRRLVVPCATVDCARRPGDDGGALVPARPPTPSPSPLAARAVA